MDNLKTLFKTLLPGNKLSNSGEPPCTYKSTNPWNEIQLLLGHKDILRVLLKLDDNRFASASDDGKIIIWNSDGGEALFELEEHTGPITCMLLLENRLVSGSVDKSICIWDINTGQLVECIKNSHSGGIKCIIALTQNTFCSGGTDRYIRVWDNDGKKISDIERKEVEESINCMLAISDKRVITGSNDLSVYRIDTKQFSHKFFIVCHREPVHCLVRVNEESFISGSLDGVIVVWQMESLSPLRKLNDPERYFIKTTDSQRYTETVNHLLVLGKRYLAACIDKGFKIYDICTGDIVMERTQAHDSQVYCIICVGGGTHLVTAGADAHIKIWGTDRNFNFLLSDYQPGGMFSRKTKAFYPPICRGEMSIHNDQVKHLLKISETSFVSGGHDIQLVIWRNGEFESELRNVDALCALQKAVDYPTPPEPPKPQSPEIIHTNGSTYSDTDSEEDLRPIYEPPRADSDATRILKITVPNSRFTDLPPRRNTFPFYTSIENYFAAKRPHPKVTISSHIKNSAENDQDQ